MAGSTDGGEHGLHVPLNSKLKIFPFKVHVIQFKV